jgi:hypothetical protein
MNSNRMSLHLLKQTGLAAAVIALTALRAEAVEHDLTAAGNQTVNVAGDVGGTAIVADHWSQPTGTGVFNPFLTLRNADGKAKIEQAYNADGHNALYMDGHRPHWNTQLRVGDLASIAINNVNYFAFILDSNEPGADKSLMSIDNIRIYTSATDNTASVQNNLGNLDLLGSLRWAMNDPTKNPDTTYNIDTWIKLDSAQENVSHGNANGGSGQADMVVYVPQAAFAGASSTDYVWFYNLNGVHYTVDYDLAAQAGFEEWSAVVGPQSSVPDGGSTVALLGLALAGLAFVARRRK